MERALAACRRAKLVEAYTMLRVAAAAVNSLHESRLDRMRRQRLGQWLVHWHHVASRQGVLRRFGEYIFAKRVWAALKEWRRVAATAANEAADTKNRAQSLANKKQNNLRQLCVQGWRAYRDVKFHLNAAGRACALSWKRQLFSKMQAAARGNRVIRLQTARHDAAVIRHSFCSWLLFWRRRMREKAVAQLVAGSGRRGLQREVLYLWALSTGHCLAASALRCRNLLLYHCRKWKAFASTQRRLRDQAAEAVSRWAAHSLWSNLRLWHMATLQTKHRRSEAFNAWKMLLNRRKVSCQVTRKISVNQDRALLVSIIRSWHELALLHRRCDLAATTNLHRKVFKALQAHSKHRVHLVSAAELLVAVRARCLVARVIGTWNERHHRLRAVREKQEEFQARRHFRMLQSRWTFWRQRTAAAGALRQWVAQALEEPIKMDLEGKLKTTPNPINAAVQQLKPLGMKSAISSSSSLRCFAKAKNGEYLHTSQQRCGSILMQGKLVKQPSTNHSLEMRRKQLEGIFGMSRLPVQHLQHRGEAPRATVNHDDYEHRLGAHQEAAGAMNKEVDLAQKQCCWLRSLRSQKISSKPDKYTLMRRFNDCKRCESSRDRAVEEEVTESSSKGHGHVKSAHTHALVRMHAMRQKMTKSPSEAVKESLAHCMRHCQIAVGDRAADQKLLRKRFNVWGEHLLVLYWRRKLLQITAAWRFFTENRSKRAEEYHSNPLEFLSKQRSSFRPAEGAN
ncbi:hypothetical protein Efla_002876 [Eimeria flavescens]